MHNFSIGNGAHFVPRLAVCIAVHGPDIDSFVKPRINEASSSAFRITDKTILAAFPWCRFRAVIVSVDILVKSGAISRKKSIIVRGQNKIENLILCRLHCHRSREQQSDNNYGEQ